MRIKKVMGVSTAEALESSFNTIRQIIESGLVSSFPVELHLVVDVEGIERVRAPAQKIKRREAAKAVAAV